MQREREIIRKGHVRLLESCIMLANSVFLAALHCESCSLQFLKL